jgi:hypothetical protein
LSSIVTLIELNCSGVKLGHVNLLSHRLFSNRLHVKADLLWDLLEHFLGEVATGLSFTEPDELDDVAGGLVAHVVSEQLVVTV